MCRWSHGNTWPIFKRCVPWCWTRGVLSQPQGKIAWFMRYQEGFRYKVQCEGRPRVNLFSWWVYHYQVYINIITQSGAGCWSVPDLAALSTIILLSSSSFWELRYNTSYCSLISRRNSIIFLYSRTWAWDKVQIGLIRRFRCRFRPFCWSWPRYLSCRHLTFILSKIAI